MFILSDFGEFIKVSETLKIDRDKHYKRCDEIKVNKKEEKEISFGEVLSRVMINHK